MVMFAERATFNPAHSTNQVADLYRLCMASLQLPRQRRFAEALGIHASHLCRVMLGERRSGAPTNMTCAHLLADGNEPVEVLADAFGRPVDDMMTMLLFSERFKSDTYLRVIELLLWVRWGYPVAKYAYLDWLGRDVRPIVGSTLPLPPTPGLPRNPFDNLRAREESSARIIVLETPERRRVGSPRVDAPGPDYQAFRQSLRRSPR